MYVLLLSPREQRRETLDVAGLSAELARRGHRVRLLQPQHSRRLPFRRVGAQLHDPSFETLVTHAIREDLPDVVHVVEIGASLPAWLPWIGNRLGAAVVASVDPALALCHRGTLVDEQGRSCSAWAEPKRCVTCCLTPFREGLGPVAAALGRTLRWLGGWSPFPNPMRFSNRLDMLIGGLLAADLVAVADAGAADLVEQAGVPRARLRPVGPPPVAVEVWLSCYEQAIAAAAGS